MKDSYSLDVDDAGLDASYQKHAVAYHRIFTRIGLDFIKVGADVGMMGGSLSEEFMAFSADRRGHHPDRRGRWTTRPTARSPPSSAKCRHRKTLLPIEEVETPNTTTIEALADFLDIPLARTAKAVFFMGQSGRFIFAVIRGDLEINETKLRQVTGEGDIVPATAERNPRHRRRAGLRLAGRRPRLPRRHRREHRALAEPRCRRQQARLPPQERELPARLRRPITWPISPLPPRATSARSAASR